MLYHWIIFIFWSNFPIVVSINYWLKNACSTDWKMHVLLICSFLFLIILSLYRLLNTSMFFYTKLQIPLQRFLFKPSEERPTPTPPPLFWRHLKRDTDLPHLLSLHTCNSLLFRGKLSTLNLFIRCSFQVNE